MPGEAEYTNLPYPLKGESFGVQAAIEKLAKAIVQPPIGAMIDWAGRGDPKDTKWLAADGRWVSRTTYAKLFEEIVPFLGTFTAVTGGTLTLNGHKLTVGDQVYFRTSGAGALPGPLLKDHIYFVSEVPTVNTFKIASTRGGASMTFSTTGTSPMEAWFCPHGLANGSTEFALPDTRARVCLSPDNMTTEEGAAGRLTTVNRVLGASGGTEGWKLTVGQMPSHSHGGSTATGTTGTGTTGTESAKHSHTLPGGVSFVTSAAGTSNFSSGTNFNETPSTEVNTTTHTHSIPGLSVPKLTITAEGGGEEHPNMQPYLIATKIIRVL